ncbi:hypothetical protein KM295_06115 [Natronomonas sp. F2-12]|jgi:hypothetical protein|uniref:Uncharacterized protein n=1 Tax=Natronomonas aquatica TaxID=2841590 RepID=A0A9R1CSM9_9EURY|nr:DUF5809 family protein [Natronomonas aquatica]MCQ4333078.1 hypothetical protein [Natronomonas aquatica]
MTDEPHTGETHGTFDPASWADAERRYEAVGSTAQVVVRAVAKAMEFDREEYDRRVDADVVETARQALFAETLAVRVADRAAFDSWREDYGADVHVAGSDAVGNVAWHASAPAGAAVAATFENEPEAAVGTVRRMAFNRLYRDRLTGDAP